MFDWVDTGGVSDHVFILCGLLGFRFCPRPRDFPDRKPVSIDPPGSCKDLQPLLGRRIKVDAIREHRDEVARLAAALKTGVVAPSTRLKTLAAYERQNRLDRALQELGRIERTFFMLDWLESPDLRRRRHAGLNKGEQRHALVQAICTFRQGRIGVALAGANRGLTRQAGGEGENGILHAVEAQTLNLYGTELVVLSACDTGKGVVDYSEGLEGLSRAFYVAGAKNVLAALWPVGDENACIFMELFYKNWLSQKISDPAAALRETKLKYVTSSDSSQRDPALWAPFVLFEG